MNRILIVCRSLPFHGVGGMEAVTWDLARELARQGNAVSVLTTSCPRIEDGIVVEGVVIRTVECPSGRLSGAWWRGSKRIYLAEFSDKTDMVMSVSSAGNSIAGVRDATKTRFIFQAHGTSWSEIKSKVAQLSIRSWVSALRNIYWIVGDLAYRRYDGICAISSSVQKDLTSFPTRLIVGKVPVYCILNGIDEKAFTFDLEAREATRSKLGLKPSDRLIVTFSRLHRQKGVGEAVGLFARMTAIDDRYHFAAIGSGPEEAALRAQIVELSLAERAKIIGPVRREDAPAWLSAADCMLFPTMRVEGLPMNILEALSTGLPVVTSPWACEPDLPCFLADPKDQDALMGAVEEAVSTLENRVSKLPEKYRLSRVAERYSRLLEGRDSNVG